jgi:DNA-binding transcriptional MocR family regulator
MKMRLLLAEFRELYPDEVPWNTGEEGFVVWLEIVRRHEEVKLPKASIKRKEEDT